MYKYALNENYSDGFLDGYVRGKADAVKEFAEWLPTAFDLRFSCNPQVWVDEFFNHSSEKLLKQLKEKNND